MSPIQLDLPGSQIISNNLYDTLSPDWLDEDLVFVRLPDGTKVDVGWHGEPGAGGFFQMVRYGISWDSPIETVLTDNVQEVARILGQFNEKALFSAVQGLAE